MYNAERASLQSGTPALIEDASQKLAAVALREIAELEFVQTQYADSEGHYKRSLDLQDSPEIRAKLAMIYVLVNQPEDAIKELDRLIAIDPNDPSLWFQKGKAELQKEDPQQAAEAFAKSNELKKDPDVQFGLANAYLQMKQKEKAQQVFQSMLQDYGDRAIWHMVFGGGYRDHGYREDAIREFKRAIELDPKLPHVHFFLALTLLENNGWGPTDESLHELQEAVRLEPRDYFANHYLGGMESKQGKLAESDEHLKVAAKADPTSPDPWLILGENAYQEKNFELTKQYLNKAIQLTGNDEARNAYQIRKAYIILGRQAIAEGKRDEGQKQLEHSKELFSLYMRQVQKQVGDQAANVSGMGPNDAPGGDLPGITAPTKASGTVSPANPDSGAAASKLTPAQKQAIEARQKQLKTILGIAFNDWGTAEARQKNYAVATELFKEASSWDSQTPGLMRNLGMAAMRQEDYADAAPALKRAVEQEPGDNTLRAMLGMALFNTNNFAEAAKAFQPLTGLPDQDPRLAYVWALSLIKTNQYQQAAAILNKLQDQQKSPDTLLLIAQAWSEMGYYPQVAAACHKALQIEPRVQRAHFIAGNAYLRLDKNEEAANEFRAEMTVSPDDVENEYSLAYVLLRQSKTDEAEAHLKAVLARAPDHPGANYQLGKALLDNGQTDQAISYLEVAARLSPNLDYVHYQLQMAYRKLGRSEDAERELAIYKQIKAEKRESSARRLEENSKKAESSNPN